MAPGPNGTQWDTQRLASGPQPLGRLVQTRGCGTGTSCGGDGAQQEPGEVSKLSLCSGCPKKDQGNKNHSAARVPNGQTHPGMRLCFPRRGFDLWGFDPFDPRGLAHAQLRAITVGYLPALCTRGFNSSSADPTQNPGHLAVPALLRKPAPS